MPRNCRIRNYLYVQRHMGAARAADHIPEFAKRVVAAYDADGSVSKRCICAFVHFTTILGPLPSVIILWGSTVPDP